MGARVLADTSVETCTDGSNCPIGKCWEGKCSGWCSTVSQCEPGQRCNERGECVECIDDSHCPIGKCYKGNCSGWCRTVSQCEPGQICNERGECVTRVLADTSVESRLEMIFV